MPSNIINTLLINVCSGRDNSGNRGHGRDGENYEKGNMAPSTSRRGQSTYQGKGGSDRDGGARGGRGRYRSSRGGNRDSNYTDGGKPPANDDQSHHDLNSSRIQNGQMKNGTGSGSETPGGSGSRGGGGATSGEESPMSSLSSTGGGNKGGNVTASDSKVKT